MNFSEKTLSSWRDYASNYIYVLCIQKNMFHWKNGENGDVRTETNQINAHNRLFISSSSFIIPIISTLNTQLFL